MLVVIGHCGRLNFGLRTLRENHFIWRPDQIYRGKVIFLEWFFTGAKNIFIISLQSLFYCWLGSHFGCSLVSKENEAWRYESLKCSLNRLFIEWSKFITSIIFVVQNAYFSKVCSSRNVAEFSAFWQGKCGIFLSQVMLLSDTHYTRTEHLKALFFTHFYFNWK